MTIISTRYSDSVSIKISDGSVKLFCAMITKKIEINLLWNYETLFYYRAKTF